MRSDPALVDPNENYRNACAGRDAPRSVLNAWVETREDDAVKSLNLSVEIWRSNSHDCDRNASSFVDAKEQVTTDGVGKR